MQIRSKFFKRMLDIIITILLILLTYRYFFTGLVVLLLVSGLFHVEEYVDIWKILVAYLAIGGASMIVGIIHYIKWFVCKPPIHLNCHNCGEKVTASKSDIYNIDSKFDPMAEHHQFQSIARLLKYRPRLFYVCPTCGQEECICPYCHKAIHPDDIKCLACGKRIL